MGNFSRDSFDPTKQYTGVRLQQGVPLVDADINELQDVLKYAFEQFLHWFVGNGVPFANDGFSITPVAVDNDFSIGAGRCLVQGQEAVNLVTLNYTNQPLFGQATLASAWGVAPLPALNTPTDAARTDIAYLDVWEREVDANEDPNIVNEMIAIETSVRNKREWVVRVAEGVAVPKQLPAGHAFYPLARFERPADEDKITQITDSRRTGLKMPSYHDLQQIIVDAFGRGYAVGLNDGPNTDEPQLKISLREAINAVLRGTMPSTAAALFAANSYISCAVVDTDGDLWVFFHDRTEAGKIDNWYRRYSRASGWEAPARLPKDPDSEDPYSSVTGAVVDTDGDLWVFYSERTAAEKQDIWYRRYIRAQGRWDEHQSRLPTNQAQNYSPHPVVDAEGDLWVFWESHGSGNQGSKLWCRRYRPDDGGWEAQETPVNRDAAATSNHHAVVDAEGDLWVFWHRAIDENIWYRRYRPDNGGWEEQDHQLTSKASPGFRPRAVVDKDRDLWVFWVSDRSDNTDIWYRRYRPDHGGWEERDSPLTTNLAPDYSPHPVVDAEGDLWVFWHSYRVNDFGDIWYRRYSRARLSWDEQDSRLTTDPESDFTPYATVDLEGDIWVFWQSNRRGRDANYEAWYCKLIPQI